MVYVALIKFTAGPKYVVTVITTVIGHPIQSHNLKTFVQSNNCGVYPKAVAPKILCTGLAISSPYYAQASSLGFLRALATNTQTPLIVHMWLPIESKLL